MQREQRERERERDRERQRNRTEEEKRCSPAGGGESECSRRGECAVSSCSQRGPSTHWDDMQPFKWTVPCAGGPGERWRGGRSWTELLSSNSLTTAVYPTHYRVCNELETGSVIGRKVQIVSFYFFFPRCPCVQSSAAVFNPLTSTCQPSVSFHSRSHSPFLPLTHTPAVFLSLPPPPPSLFFFHSIIYIHLFVLGKLTPTSVEGKGGWLKAPKGKTFQLREQT